MSLKREDTSPYNDNTNEINRKTTPTPALTPNPTTSTSAHASTSVPKTSTSTSTTTTPNKTLPSITQVSRPFFTSNELSFLHSITIPEQKKIAYSQRKHQIFQFIFQIIKILKFPLRILNTTMIYYQRYYLFNKFEEINDDPNPQNTIDLEKDPYIVAVTCLFLATKNEDCIKKLKDILTVANKIRDIDQEKNNFFDYQKKIIMNLEFKFLQIIKFDFINGSNNLPSVDQLIIQFCKKLNLDYKSTMFCWLISFDIMSTPLGLILPPHCISLSIIIITLNLKPNDIQNKYNKIDNSISDSNDYNDKLNEILEKIDSFNDFNCPESLVNEGIIYLLDYYIHQMNFSILNEYLPSINKESGKEQIFKFMDLKSRFNDLKTLNESSTSDKHLLIQDKYLKKWDYSVGLKGSVRFIPGNKRRRFDNEFDLLN